MGFIEIAGYIHSIYTSKENTIKIAHFRYPLHTLLKQVPTRAQPISKAMSNKTSVFVEPAVEVYVTEMDWRYNARLLLVNSIEMSPVLLIVPVEIEEGVDVVSDAAGVESEAGEDEGVVDGLLLQLAKSIIIDIKAKDLHFFIKLRLLFSFIYLIYLTQIKE